MGAPQLIADNTCAHPFVLGPEAPVDWRKKGLAGHAALGLVTGRIERLGKAANALNDPRLALTCLRRAVATPHYAQGWTARHDRNLHDSALGPTTMPARRRGVRAHLAHAKA